ncbi:hypothetical protein KI387_018875, partial [Taxus chinensis]
MPPIAPMTKIVEVSDSPSVPQDPSFPFSLPFSLPTSVPSTSMIISSFPSPSMAQLFSSLPFISAKETIGSPFYTSLPLTLPFPSISSPNIIVSTPMVVLTSTPSIATTTIQMPTNVVGTLVVTNVS